MCDRHTDRRIRPVCKNVVENTGPCTCKDLPALRVPTGKRLLRNDRPDCTSRRGQCLSSFQKDNTAARRTDSNDDWEDLRDPYNNTATGFLGVRRKSMLTNPLLNKHKIGSSLRCCRKLPCIDFIYGSLPAHSPSAALALRGWSGDVCLKTWVHTKKQIMCTNFLALNRAAVTAGTSGHDDWRDFRNTHRIRFTGLEANEHERRAPPIALDPDATFGRPTRYISTAEEIMSGREYKDWLRCVKSCNVDRQEGTKIDSWKENHAYTLRMFKKPTELKPNIPWHMPKFEDKAKPHLSTFRSMTDAIKAHNANNYEKVGRDGMFGQGIPTKACNRKDALCCFKP